MGLNTETDKSNCFVIVYSTFTISVSLTLTSEVIKTGIKSQLGLTELRSHFSLFSVPCIPPSLHTISERYFTQNIHS